MNGCFVDAAREESGLVVRQLRSQPTDSYGSVLPVRAVEKRSGRWHARARLMRALRPQLLAQQPFEPPQIAGPGALGASQREFAVRWPPAATAASLTLSPSRRRSAGGQGRYCGQRQRPLHKFWNEGHLQLEFCRSTGRTTTGAESKQSFIRAQREVPHPSVAGAR